MAEYIERESLLNEIRENKLMLREPAAKRIIGIIESGTTADVRPERHGRWIKDESGVIICSECGEEHDWIDYRANFCEQCGAKMSWEDNDNG